MSRGPVRVVDPLAQALGYALTDVIRQAVRAEAADLLGNPGDWLTTAQAAERLGLSENTVIRSAMAGELPYGRVGRAFRFSARAIDQHLGYRPPDGVASSAAGDTA